MSRNNRNFVVGYVLFVALPLLGLAGVLKSGHNLKAPISVDGTWTVQPETTNAAPTTCLAPLGAEDQSVVISQSGANFTLVVSAPGRTVLNANGTLEGNTLRAVVKPSAPTESGCPELSLLATVNAAASPKVLAGSWTAGPSSINFHAQLQTAASARGGH